MFDFIAEIVAQLVMEMIGDFLLRFGANTIGRAMATKTGHVIALATALLAESDDRGRRGNGLLLVTAATVSRTSQRIPVGR
jgi:hypothetical protein